MAFGFVLVGGQSARMGRDKTRLPYRGLPMAIHQAQKLAFVCGRVALVGKAPGAFASSPYPFVLDGSEPHASVFGVLAALAYSPDDVNLILAADLPRISEAFLAALLDVAQHSPAAAAVIPVSADGPQPLCAVYRRSALVSLTNRVANGDLSLVSALRGTGALFLPESETAALPDGEADRFLNVNTPEDYAAVEDETGPYASRR